MIGRELLGDAIELQPRLTNAVTDMMTSHLQNKVRGNLQRKSSWQADHSMSMFVGIIEPKSFDLPLIMPRSSAQRSARLIHSHHLIISYSNPECICFSCSD
jgi:hypothetical protein